MYARGGGRKQRGDKDIEIYNKCKVENRENSIDSARHHGGALLPEIPTEVTRRDLKSDFKSV
jgi:hypothetical protein